MNVRNHFRVFAKAISSTLSKSFVRKIARETKFVQRKGKFSPEDFLALCSFSKDSISDDSLNELVGSLSFLSRQSLSKQALQERFNERAVEFLKQIFFELMRKQRGVGTPVDAERLFSRIRIMDATAVHLPLSYTGYQGPHGQSAKVQLEYEFYSGTFLQTSVHHGGASDRRAAEDVMNSLKPGDLCIRDLGYYSARNLSAIDEKGAYFISRIPANTKLWRWDNGWEEIHPVQDVQELKPGETIDYGSVRVGTDPRNRFMGRVIVQKLTKEQERQRKASLEKKKQKGRPTQSASKKTNIQILVTNVTQDTLDAQDLYPLYALRWQVEILFKTWKSLFELDHVREAKQSRFECHLYGTLIRILLSSQLMFECRYLLYKKESKETSEYKGLQQAKKMLPKLAGALFYEPKSILDLC
ncbi:IS4 family transposase, partial [Halobacillus fulvus]